MESDHPKRSYNELEGIAEINSEPEAVETFFTMYEAMIALDDAVSTYYLDVETLSKNFSAEQIEFLMTEAGQVLLSQWREGFGSIYPQLLKGEYDHRMATPMNIQRWRSLILGEKIALVSLKRQLNAALQSTE